MKGFIRVQGEEREDFEFIGREYDVFDCASVRFFVHVFIILNAVHLSSPH